MGLTTADFPPVDPATFMQTPYRERTRRSRGTGPSTASARRRSPASSTSSSCCSSTCWAACSSPRSRRVWTRSIRPSGGTSRSSIRRPCSGPSCSSACDVAGSWGPLAGHFKPMTGGPRYYARVNTIRLPPWPDKVPFTKGDARTRLDVALYVALIASLIVALALPAARTRRSAMRSARTRAWSRRRRSSLSSCC